VRAERRVVLRDHGDEAEVVVRVRGEDLVARLLGERETLLVRSPGGGEVAHPVRQAARGGERGDPDARIRGHR